MVVVEVVVVGVVVADEVAVVGVVVIGAVVMGVPTCKITGALLIPDMVAVILVVPFANPVAKPAEEIVATAISELDQFT